MRRGFVVGAVVVVVMAVLLGIAARSAPNRRPTRLAVFGDSLTYEGRKYLLPLINSTNRYETHLLALPGTAICDWFPYMQEQRKTFNPQVVAFQFVGNDILACMRGPGGSKLSNAEYLARWEADTRKAIAMFDPHVTIYLVGNPEMRSGDNRVYDIFQRLARDYPNTHFFDGGALVSPHRTFVTTLPCLAGEPCTGPVVNGVHTNVVRAWDGIHFCPVKTTVFGAPCPVYQSGAYRFALAEFEGITHLPGPATALLSPAVLTPSTTTTVAPSTAP